MTNYCYEKRSPLTPNNLHYSLICYSQTHIEEANLSKFALPVEIPASDTGPFQTCYKARSRPSINMINLKQSISWSAVQCIHRSLLWVGDNNDTSQLGLSQPQNMQEATDVVSWEKLISVTPKQGLTSHWLVIPALMPSSSGYYGRILSFFCLRFSPNTQDTFSKWRISAVNSKRWGP